MNIFYVYAYIREKDSETAKAGTPYYIGYGKNKRAYSKHHVAPVPKDISRIVILERNLSEIGAKALERRLIKWWGRKDLRSGILLNRTDGGEGTSGIIFSKEHRNKLSIAKLGIRRGPRSPAERKTISDSTRGKPKPPHTEKTKEKISKGLSGRKLSSETKEKISRARKGLPSSTKGLKWWNDGNFNKRSAEKPGSNFKEGFLMINRKSPNKAEKNDLT